jgi:hypothetical protein
MPTYRALPAVTSTPQPWYEIDTFTSSVNADGIIVVKVSGFEEDDMLSGQ